MVERLPSFSMFPFLGFFLFLCLHLWIVFHTNSFSALSVLYTFVSFPISEISRSVSFPSRLCSYSGCVPCRTLFRSHALLFAPTHLYRWDFARKTCPAIDLTGLIANLAPTRNVTPNSHFLSTCPLRSNSSRLGGEPIPHTYHIRHRGYPADGASDLVISQPCPRRRYGRRLCQRVRSGRHL
jgi:hypothetical protein